jgi:hypothetical protein
MIFGPAPEVTMKKVLLVLLLLIPLNSFADGLTVRYPRPESLNLEIVEQYYVDLLRIALEKTEKSDGPFQVQKSAVSMLKNAAIQSLAKGGGLDVMWLMTNKEREDLLLPVRIPVLKGTLGYRALIIRKKDREKFESIKTLADLRKLTAVQGEVWMDTRILEANGLPVAGVKGYESMFFLISKGKHDYFPRGINEIWKEIELHGSKGLMVEEKIVLHYDSPMYFFVNRSNAALADRINRGLRIAIEDGSFDKHFFNHPLHKETFDKTGLRSRKIFRLDNPYLPEKTPLEDRKLWLDPWQIP